MLSRTPFTKPKILCQDKEVCKCKIPGSCKKELFESELDFYEFYCQEVKNLDLEKGEIPKDFISLELLYDQISEERDIQRLLEKLEKIEIIGENVLKYWDKNKILCKLEIINPDYIVKTEPIN